MFVFDFRAVIRSTTTLVVLLCSCVFATSQTACLLEHCARELAQCEVDTVCRTWSTCTRGCASIKDPVKQTNCQIRCGDLYQPTNSSSAKITAFSECVISKFHCINQTKTNCSKPALSGLVPSFSLKTDLVGVWYITRGQNPVFDCFDCQVHNFTFNPNEEPSTKPLHGDLKWNVKVDLNCTGDDCKYLPREVHQSFSQDAHNPAHLMNYNNTLAELHYSDDWYVLYASKSSVLIYYCGCNDAECGYGGSVLYSRTPQLPAEEEAALQVAVAGAKIPGFNFNGLCVPKKIHFVKNQFFVMSCAVVQD